MGVRCVDLLAGWLEAGLGLHSGLGLVAGLGLHSWLWLLVLTELITGLALEGLAGLRILECLVGLHDWHAGHRLHLAWELLTWLGLALELARLIRIKLAWLWLGRHLHRLARHLRLLIHRHAGLVWLLLGHLEVSLSKNGRSSLWSLGDVRLTLHKHWLGSVAELLARNHVWL